MKSFRKVYRAMVVPEISGETPNGPVHESGPLRYQVSPLMASILIPTGKNNPVCIYHDENPWPYGKTLRAFEAPNPKTRNPAIFSDFEINNAEVAAQIDAGMKSVSLRHFQDNLVPQNSYIQELSLVFKGARDQCAITEENPSDTNPSYTATIAAAYDNPTACIVTSSYDMSDFPVQAVQTEAPAPVAAAPAPAATEAPVAEEEMEDEVQEQTSEEGAENKPKGKRPPRPVRALDETDTEYIMNVVDTGYVAKADRLAMKQYIISQAEQVEALKREQEKIQATNKELQAQSTAYLEELNKTKSLQVSTLLPMVKHVATVINSHRGSVAAAADTIMNPAVEKVLDTIKGDETVFKDHSMNQFRNVLKPNSNSLSDQGQAQYNRETELELRRIALRDKELDLEIAREQNAKHAAAAAAEPKKKKAAAKVSPDADIKERMKKLRSMQGRSSRAAEPAEEEDMEDEEEEEEEAPKPRKTKRKHEEEKPPRAPQQAEPYSHYQVTDLNPYRQSVAASAQDLFGDNKLTAQIMQNLITNPGSKEFNALRSQVQQHVAETGPRVRKTLFHTDVEGLSRGVGNFELRYHDLY